MVSDYEADVARLEEELKLALAERDPADDKDVIVEIRGGEGGDEGKLWAGDLREAAAALRRAARLQVGGDRGRRRATPAASRRATFAIKGDGAYSVFKFEGGTHRVQRVPETESQGRIHTSTATVAVMPEAEDVDVEVEESDLKIDVYRSSGPGRPVREHDRLRGAHHAPADGDRRRDAGRALAAAEPREGDARPARAHLRGRARAPGGRAGGGAQRAGRHRRARREDPHVQLPAEPRHRPPREAERAARAGARRTRSTTSPTR